MEKNWLIRTKSNHILGPVSKEKVLELYQKGSIKPDDEICSGNGYWFFIRETDLVERFLIGDDAQDFNPMSEAKDVLTATGPSVKDVTRDDITFVASIDQLTRKEEAATSTTNNHLTLQEARPKKVKPPKSEASQIKSVKKTQHQNYLKFLLLIGFLLLFFILYFRKTLIKSLSHIESIPSAYAQVEEINKKKSS
jgi:hypothetical protein